MTDAVFIAVVLNHLQVKLVYILSHLLYRCASAGLFVQGVTEKTCLGTHSSGVNLLKWAELTHLEVVGVYDMSERLKICYFEGFSANEWRTVE